jgi:hypothetical protein
VLLEQFTVQPTSAILTVITAGVIALGIFMIIVGTSKKLTHILATHSLKMHPVESRLVYLIVGVIVIGVGVTIYATTSIPSTITVGDHYVSYQSPPIIGAGNMNVTADQIASAYIGHLGQGDLTLKKEYGTNAGSVNIGVFTLGNGKTAHVLTNNSTSLIVALKDDSYLILGTSNTMAFAESFSRNVFPIAP